MNWNDGHMDGIGESILGLSIVVVALLMALSLFTGRPEHDGQIKGGCCNSAITITKD